MPVLLLLALLLIIAWLVGLVGFAVTSASWHVLLIVALVIVLYSLYKRNKPLV